VIGLSFFRWLRLAVIFSLGLLVLSSLNPTQVSAALVWNEDFETHSIEDLNDWILQGYELVNDSYYQVHHGFTIENGELTSEDIFVVWPDTGHGVFTQIRRAIHDSSVVYGTWSFDWRVSKSQHTFDSVEIMFTDLHHNYNLTGELTAFDMIGYSLILDTVTNNELLIEKFGGTTNFILARRPFDTMPSGLHHIDITRDLTGRFNVYFDSVLVLTVTDNEITTSVKFVFASFQGNSSIDNIAISNSIDIVPTDAYLPILLIGIGAGISLMVVVILIYLKRKS
jgi:hypothetical protein